MTYAQRLRLRRRQLRDKRNPAAVALANIAAQRKREARAEWVKRHIEQLRATF